MPIYVVRDNARWGYSLNVVRAASPEQARKFVRKDHANPSVACQMDCEQLREGEGILWCHDESPDSRD